MDEIQRMQEHLYAEIIKYPDETEMLKNILDVFVDYPEKYKQEDREGLIDKSKFSYTVNSCRYSNKKSGIYGMDADRKCAWCGSCYCNRAYWKWSEV